jgi:predicted transcriptional regulator of viral defense system
VNPEKPPATAARLVDRLAASGRYHFTTGDAVKALGVSPVAARAALRRLAAKGAIVSPHRGFHVIVPPEYRRLHCLPAEQFVPQLMAHLGIAYYAGLLTAAQFHGAAHQRPQAFQVLVQRNRAPIECGEVRVEFLARKAIARVPVTEVNTPRGVLRISSPEATAIDLVGYQGKAGGVDTVATVLAELAERLDADKLVATARTAPIPWAQRLGYLLDHAGAADKTDRLAKWVRGHATEYAQLIPGGRRAGERSKKWRLVANAKVEIEA